MRTTLRPCVCRRALSPLLGGPFLMSPRRRQSATPGPLPASPRHQVGSVPRSAVHGCLRGSYEARSPPGAFLRKPPAGLLATGCRVFLLTEYPYDPFIRRWTPSRDACPPSELFFPVHPPQSTCSAPRVGVRSNVSHEQVLGQTLPPSAAAYLPRRLLGSRRSPAWPPGSCRSESVV